MEDRDLWLEYKKTGRNDLRNELVIKYMGLVEIVAHKMANRIGGMVPTEELISYGIEGLMDSIEKYDMDMPNKFETYASIRINGQILDAMRQNDWVPRSTRKKSKDMKEVIFKLENKYGRTPTNKDIAKELKISLKDTEELIKETELQSMTSLDEMEGTKGWIDPVLEEGDPEGVFEKSELKEIIAYAIEQLEDREQKVVSMYYMDELTLREIGEVLELSEGRIHQIRKKSLGKLKRILKKISYDT